MDVLALLKKKEQSRRIKGSRGSLEAKLDGMIKWMKEMRTMLQEFVRINGLPEPYYPPDMFGPIPTQHVGEGVEVDSEEEGPAQEYPRMENEYESTF
ncbi:hypothetical protein J1N35_043775 [Gossypium stocksii]|uniref:Uncharacterized protein n=1 Tax=Gossypium stocksii TaxID=47602 RepID=A0A9D3U7U5_9ROSI|nr:hypothetical protein J1N35_043775 [Gossypium stocksii]